MYRPACALAFLPGFLHLSASLGVFLSSASCISRLLAPLGISRLLAPLANIFISPLVVFSFLFLRCGCRGSGSLSVLWRSGSLSPLWRLGSLSVVAVVWLSCGGFSPLWRSGSLSVVAVLLVGLGGAFLLGGGAFLLVGLSSLSRRGFPPGGCSASSPSVRRPVPSRLASSRRALSCRALAPRGGLRTLRGTPRGRPVLCPRR